MRVLPPGLYAGQANKVIERSALVTRRHWVIVLSGLLEPVFYLLAIQVGFGVLVGTVIGPAGEPIPYEQFVAPALLGAAAMNGAIFETTYPIYFKLRFNKLYDAMLATPLGPYDVAIGEIGWATVRGSFYSLGFVAVMAAMGVLPSTWALLMVPVAALIAFAFASVGMALATYIQSPTQFDYISLVAIPLFLFSTTFYPLSVYPAELQWAVQLSPLYHGIELLRQCAHGVFDWAMFGHVAVLVGLAAVGVIATSRRIGAMLLR
ncbi:ABC transporter permease [Thermocrispum municipale]|jgi:lipooligosaccharide transport system permease protein|uniref:ABC transporter permease n=1 Tax=Thermocrispum municipale TaxID=37926 RepID=UPI001FE1872A|nr:ABC transporter permease [Thermocrispum municipale]